MNNIILVTSIIKPPPKPLSYAIRSVYTDQERFEQTKLTIETIKQKIPNSKIFIVECSELNDEETSWFIENTDYCINLYSDEHLRNNIHSLSKSLGEGTMTIRALEFLISQNIQYDSLIKISGRYYLSDKFNYNNFYNDKIVFKYINNDTTNASTALYKLPKYFVTGWLEFLKNKIIDMYNCIGFEQLFAMYLSTIDKEHIQHYDILGLEGYISVSGEFYIG